MVINAQLTAGNRRAYAGFTLIEALVALLVLAVGLLGLAHLQTNVLETSSESKTRTIALSLTQKKLEELRAQASGGYSALADGSDSPPSSANASFSRSWTVTENASMGYKTLEVTTTWQTPDGEQKSVELTSRVAEPALAQVGGTGAGGGGGGGSGGNDDDEDEEDGEGDGDTGDDGTETGDGDTSNGGTDNGDTNGDTGEGDGTEEDPGSCQCFYKNPGQGASLVDSDTNGSCCTDAFCDSNVPADVSNHSSFTVACP